MWYENGVEKLRRESISQLTDQSAVLNANTRSSTLKAELHPRSDCKDVSGDFEVTSAGLNTVSLQKA